MLLGRGGSYGGYSQRPSGQWRSVGFSPLQSHQPLAELLMHPWRLAGAGATLPHIWSQLPWRGCDRGILPSTLNHLPHAAAAALSNAALTSLTPTPPQIFVWINHQCEYNNFSTDDVFMMRNITLWLISYSEWVILIRYDTLLTSNMCVMLQPSLIPTLLEEPWQQTPLVAKAHWRPS